MYYFSQSNNASHSIEPISSIVNPKSIVTDSKPISKKNGLNEMDRFQNHVKSFEGTQPDGAINIDEYGEVIVDKDLKRLFDYFLSAIGELPLDQMRKYLQKFASEKLTQEQLSQVMDYFDKYHQYLSEADSFFENRDDLNLEEKMQLLSDYRTESLGEKMSDAFFADEQNYIEYVLGDKHSDDLSRQQAWLESENRATEFQDVVIENREFMAAEEIDPSEIYNYRVEQYGQEAADRLSQLDQQRVQWQSVVDTYFEQRQQINNQQSDLSLEQLHSNYTDQEIRRLEAQWRISNQ